MRTPDEHFANLPGFSFAPHYLQWKEWRVHYLDEGKGERTFLCLHGEPTWCYLYRRMIPGLLARGARIVAPDFVGFGRSDKPEDEALYTFDFHRAFLLDFIRTLRLKNITLVVQDWGGLLGLTLPMEVPEISGLFIMNTALATGDAPLTEGFVAWRAYVAKNPDLACGKLLGRACPHLTAAEAAAYDAPFPDARYKAGVRRFPPLVPEHRDDPGAAISRKAREWLRSSWKGESLMAVGAKDPVLGVPVMRQLRSWIRGCPEPVVIENGGHFLQEWGEEVLSRWK
ncbi:MAG TPA: haloalkane dehalogenase [Burkholderiales bacterium]|jgi:pimeloyl-ACP methyl ester carboxylesterase|nr:haloalkane dehalogenase [Burkholderiales bacterium]